MLQYNSTLRTLDLSSNKMGFEQCLLLATGIMQNTTLAHIVLNNCALEPEAVSVILKTLQRDRSPITSIGLGGSIIGKEEWSVITDILKDTKSLEILCLNNTNLNEESCACIGEGLRYNRTLKMLFLKDNNMGSGGCAYITASAVNHPTLAEMYLSGCRIANDGCHHVAQMIKQNTRLLKLNLLDNDFDEFGAMCIKGALRENSSLQILQMYKDEGHSPRVQSADKRLV